MSKTRRCTTIRFSRLGTVTRRVRQGSNLRTRYRDAKCLAMEAWHEQRSASQLRGHPDFGGSPPSQRE